MHCIATVLRCITGIIIILVTLIRKTTISYNFLAVKSRISKTSLFVFILPLELMVCSFPRFIAIPSNRLCTSYMLCKHSNEESELAQQT